MDTNGTRPKIVVVDYGAGNLRSVARALEASGAEAIVTEHGRDFAVADALVLPGVGAAGAAMRGLNRRDLIGPLRDAVASGRPFLGVCLGLQVLMSWSDEDGGVECLDIVPGRVVRLPDGLKIPHIGWNQVQQTQPHRLYAGIPNEANFYFVHSYVVVPDDRGVVAGVTEYGRPFTSAIAVGNVFASQFHPEKSAIFGLRVYRNFVNWARESSSVQTIVERA